VDAVLTNVFLKRIEEGGDVETLYSLAICTYNWNRVRYGMSSNRFSMVSIFKPSVLHFGYQPEFPHFTRRIYTYRC